MYNKVNVLLLYILPGPILVHLDCTTIFEVVFIESPTIELQWDPVNTSVPECPNNDIHYCVSYRCCNDTSWKRTKTANTSIEFQLSEGKCQIDKQVVFSVQIEGSNSYRYVTVNLQNITGMN